MNPADLSFNPKHPFIDVFIGFELYRLNVFDLPLSDTPIEVNRIITYLQKQVLINKAER